MNIVSIGGISISNARKFVDLINNAIPIRLVHTYAICLIPKWGWRSFLPYVIPRLPLMPRQIQKCMTIHMANSRKDMLARLETSGFSEDGTLDALGGSWSYEVNFKASMHEQ